MKSGAKLSIVFAVGMVSGPCWAIDVFLDFTDFAPNAATAWTAGGSPGGALTASDYLYLSSHGIKDRMEAQFAGYSVTFHTSVPGGVHETVKFGASTSGSDFGLATRLDWRNAFKDDTAYIYSHNFGGVISAVPSDHATSLERFANALAGTAAHELGHNLGLQHYDPYGHTDITAPGYGGITGQQNESIMATGSTGLTLARRGDDPRTFFTRELMKLDFADGVSTSLGSTISEVGSGHSTAATAQALVGSMLPHGSSAVNVAGSIGSSGEFDLYKFDATMGSLISANTFSAFVKPSVSDTSIALYDAFGTALLTNDDISYSGMSFMGGSGFYSSDSLIQHFAAPYTGTYYVGVAGSTGDYDLLISGLTPVPEPSSMILAIGGIASLLGVRKKRK